MNALILYIKDTCPYCQTVLDFMHEQGIQLPLKNLSTTPKFREELIKIGGKPQVPCLVIDGKALYESDDIIRWLGENWMEEGAA
jgi:glutaredoxin